MATLFSSQLVTTSIFSKVLRFVSGSLILLVLFNHLPLIRSIFTVTEKGVPQGTAISMFLANVACYELDKNIERKGALFARFSDDSAIICDSYSTADECAKLMHAHGSKSGTVINFEKSEGILSLQTADVVN